MGSSRLPGKSLRLIHGVPLIRRCLHNCFRFPVPKENIILAAPWTEENNELGNYLQYIDGDVTFFRGNPTNLIERYLHAALSHFNYRTKSHGLSTVIRVTGDNPFPSWEIAEILLNEHHRVEADYTEARRAAIGTSCQIYSIGALAKLNKMYPSPLHSEHMSLYIKNNPKHFAINVVELPENLIRNYRLTLDYPEDLEMFNRLFMEVFREGLSGAASIHDIFSILDKNPDISIINAHRKQIIDTNPEIVKAIENENSQY